MEYKPENSIIQSVISTSSDYYNITDWEVYIYNLDVSVLKNETANVTVGEIKKVITTPVVSNLTEAGIFATRYINITNGTGASFKKGDPVEIISDGVSYFNTILNINGDTLFLRKTLSADILSGSEIKKVGNTGDYILTIDPATTTSSIIGESRYIIQVKSPSANIDITTAMFGVSNYDMNKHLGKDIDYIKKSLDNLTSKNFVKATIHIGGNSQVVARSIKNKRGYIHDEPTDITMYYSDDYDYIHVLQGTVTLISPTQTYVLEEDDLAILNSMTIMQSELDELNADDVFVLDNVNFKVY